MSNLGPTRTREVITSFRAKFRSFIEWFPSKYMMYWMQKFGITGILVVLILVKLTTSYPQEEEEFRGEPYEYEDHYRDDMSDDTGLRFQSTNRHPLVDDHKDRSPDPLSQHEAVIPVAPPPLRPQEPVRMQQAVYSPAQQAAVQQATVQHAVVQEAAQATVHLSPAQRAAAAIAQHTAGSHMPMWHAAASPRAADSVRAAALAPAAVRVREPAPAAPQHAAVESRQSVVKEAGFHFVSSHPTKPAPSIDDNWVDSMDRPYFPKGQDRYFSFNVHEEKIEGMATKLPKTLENYKNPCWFEEVPTAFTYNNSFFNRYYKAGFGQLPWGDWETTFRNMEHRIQYRKRQSRDGKGWRLRCYPYYFVLGFTKAGTTDYCHQLHRFPTLFSGIKKEPQYWNKIRSVPTKFPGDQLAIRPSISDYLDLYDAAGEGIRKKVTEEHHGGHPYHTGIVGDCDPQTVWQLFGWQAMQGNDDPSQPSYKTPSHLYALNHKTKFIILLRDPVERAFSHYKFFQGGNKDAKTQVREFHENVNRTINLLNECTRTQTTKQCIHDRTLVPKAIHTSVTVGLYSTHIREWLNVYLREQFLFLKSEDYFDSREKAIRDTIDFLGLDLEGQNLSDIEDVEVINPNTIKIEMKHETKQLLRWFFRPYNQDLVNLLQDNTYRWDY